MSDNFGGEGVAVRKVNAVRQGIVAPMQLPFRKSSMLPYLPQMRCSFGSESE